MIEEAVNKIIYRSHLHVFFLFFHIFIYRKVLGTEISIIIKLVIFFLKMNNIYSALPQIYETKDLRKNHYFSVLMVDHS